MQDLGYEVEAFLHHRINDSTRIVLAFSGGLDSCVLMQVLQKVLPGNRLLAWHVHHGLLECADEMASFCRKIAAEYQVEFKVSYLHLDATQPNLESIARRARYDEFEKGLSSSDVLVTAHHADDQLETLFLNLFRGSGSAGLRGIAPDRQLAEATLLRPLLEISRDAIESYARQHAIEWFEDPSNQSSRFDRNFIRHQIVPVLKSRWPGLLKSIGRVCRIQVENQQILDEVGEEDYRRCYIDPLRLDKTALLQLSQARQKNVVKYWVRKNRLNSIPVGRLESLIKQLQSRHDAVPKIQGKGYQIRVFDARVYIVKSSDHLALEESYCFDESGKLLIPALSIRLSRSELFEYLSIDDNGQEIHIGFRSKDVPSASEKHRLKRLFQKHRVPPWLRDRTPLIFTDGILTDIYILPVEKVDN